MVRFIGRKAKVRKGRGLLGVRSLSRAKRRVRAQAEGGGGGGKERRPPTTPGGSGGGQEGDG